MPFYTFRCTNGHNDALYLKIDQRNDVKQCQRCGANTIRQIEAPAVRPDIAPYRSPVSGHWIDSRAARMEDLKRNNCIEWEPGIKQDLPRIKQELADKAAAPLEACIENTARELVASGKLDPI